MSVTLALIGTMAFSGVITTPNPSSFWESKAAILRLQEATCGCFAISFLSAGFGVVLCLVFFAQVNQLPLETLFPFLQKYYWAFWLTSISLLTSVFALMTGTLLFILVASGNTVTIIFGIIAILGTVGTIALYLSMNRTTAQLLNEEQGKMVDQFMENKEK